MFSGNNKKEMTCEEWLRDMDGRDREMIADHLANRSEDIKRQAASESLQQDNQASYVVEALLCKDVNQLDVTRLEKAYEYLLKKKEEDLALRKKQKGMMMPDHNEIPASIIKAIEVTLAYLALKRNIIDLTGFAQRLTKATQGDDPAMVILPKADLRQLELTGADLCCANLQDADLSDCKMEKVKFKNANFNQARLVKTIFQSCELQSANLADVNWLETKFGSGEGRSDLTEVSFLPETYLFKSYDKFVEFLEQCRILGIPELVILDNINRNFMNNKYSLEDKLNFYSKAFYHPCFNTKVGMFKISKDAERCKTMIGGQIKALKHNILEKPENLRQDLQNLVAEVAEAENAAKKAADVAKKAEREVYRTAQLAAKAALAASGEKQYDKYAVNDMVETKKAADAAAAKAIDANEASAKAAAKAAELRAKNTAHAEKVSSAFKDASAQAGRIRGKK